MELKNFFAQDSQGNAQPNATCYLYAVGTETIVTGLVDVTDTPLANPFNSDPYGLIQFKAPNGIYDLRVVSGVRDYRIRVQCNDLNESIAAAKAEADRAQAIVDGFDNDTAYISYPFSYVTGTSTYDVRTISGEQTTTTNNMGLWVEGAIEFDYVINDDFTFTLGSVYPNGISMRILRGTRKFSDISTQFATRSQLAASDGASLVGTPIGLDLSTTTISVSNLAALRAATKPVIAAGRTLSVWVSSHTIDNDGGEGMWYWQGDSNEVDDNALVVVPNGATVGRWKRVFSDFIKPEWFGATGLGLVDDSTAIGKFFDACLTYSVKGRGKPGAKYKISTQISKTLVQNQVLDIDWNGSTLIQGGNNLVLSLLNSANGLVKPTTSITETSVNLGDGSTNTIVMQIVATAHPFTTAGEIGKIFSDDIVPDSDGSNQFRGEFFTVGSIIDANTFTTTGVFDETYLTNPKVVKPSNAKVDFSNLSGESVWVDTTTSSFMNIQGFLSPRLQKLSAKNINAAFLNLTSNYKPSVQGIIGRSLKNRPDLGAYGYLVNDSAGFYGDISRIDCVLARHAYTTTTPTSTIANDDKWWLRGRTIGSVVSDSTAQGCANAFDTHSPALRITFDNCVSIDDFRGNATGGAGIQIRANDCRVIDCDVTNSKIGVAQSGANKTSNATLTISGLRYRGPNGHIPVVVNGSATYETVVNFDDGNITTINGVAFDVTNAYLNVTNTKVSMSPAINGASVVKLNAGGRLDWDSGSVSILAGVSHKLVEHAETDTICYMDNVRVRGVTGRLSYLSSSAAQYAIQSRFRGMQLDAALPGVPFLGVEATLPKVSADYVVGFNSRPIGYRVFTFGTAGNQTLDLQFTGHESVFVRIEATIAGVVINSITQGAFPGQRLIINNRNSSTSSFVIANNSSGLLFMGTSATLTAGRGITLVWDGSNWRSADMH
jgi:hypothetical protein